MTSAVVVVERKYMKDSCLLGETFGCSVSSVSIRHDTLIDSYSSTQLSLKLNWDGG